MPVEPIFIDLTEIVSNPLLTGIQRVERELIRFWPGPGPLIPCFFDPKTANFVMLPSDVCEVLLADGGNCSDWVALQSARLAERLHKVTPQPVSEFGGNVRLLNAEVFFDCGRADAYIQFTSAPKSRAYWLVFDFLPYLRPEIYESGETKHLMHYLRALRSVSHVAFISYKTRDDYLLRVMRSSRVSGPVFPLGGDGIGLQRQSFSPEKRSFVFVGTIEPKKNVASIIHAYILLRQAGCKTEFVLAGHVSERAKQEKQLFDSMRSDTGLRHVGHVSDSELRSILSQARATLFVSTGEGFGIPPYESLRAGIPTIVGPDIPSIALLPPDGQIRLPSSDPSAIAEAVKRMTNDDFAAELWQDASRVQIPTWSDFARNVAAWVQGE